MKQNLLALAGLAAAISCAGGAAAQDIDPVPAFTAEELTAWPTDSWPTNGGNLYNQRYSPLDQINRENVGELKAVWRASLEGSGIEFPISGQAQTLFQDGVFYIVTGENDVYAFDIDTGEKIWSYKPEIAADDVIMCCGRVSRGLGMGDGKIFVGQNDAHLVALDSTTGEVVWDIEAEDWEAGYSITSAPLYFDGMVITGYAGGEYGIRGHVDAFDADTGELVWRFNTIPGPGEFGHDTWPQDSDAWMYGGAPVWQTPAIDPELGLVIFTTGNPGPDLSGATRAGDNLFSTSFVALDVHTGEYRWHFQQVHHDIWDYDAPQPVVLFDAEIDGVMRKGAAEAGKNGYLYILDRTNGEPLIGIPETPVPQEPVQKTSPTQPIPIGDDIVPHEIDIMPEGWEHAPNKGRTYTPFGNDQPVLWKPSTGVSWPPASYDPDTHLMYICANDSVGGGVHAGLDELEPEGGTNTYMGGQFQSARGVPRRGIFAAVDLTTNRLAWRQSWAGGCHNPSAATAGGLVFVGRNDGRMTALDSSTGARLWEFRVDAGVNAPPTVFEWEGVQYVAVLAGGSAYAPGESGDGLWLFALNGEIESLPEEAAATGGPAAGASTAMEPVEVPDRMADLANGETLFNAICAVCHGPDGRTPHDSAPVLDNTMSVQLMLTQATHGSGDMPGFGAAYPVETLHDIAAYAAELVKDQPPVGE